MIKAKILIPAALLTAAIGLRAQNDRTWTLKACIDHALANNISLKKARAEERSAGVDLLEARAGRLPDLNASVTQGLTYRPFQEQASSLVNGSIASASSNKATQSGNYGINASWTVWDGRRTKLGIEDARLGERLAGLASDVEANSIQEQIAQLYVQIRYMQEAARVNEELLAHDRSLCERGRELLAQGQMAASDLAQLEAQVSSGLYDVVSVRTQIADSKVQLVQLLELAPGTPFDVDSAALDEGALAAPLPDRLDVYADALAQRPEIKSGQLSVERSALAVKTARAAYMPTVSLTAGLGDSHMTGTRNDFFSQMKNNFNANLGLSLSIPIFDRRQTKSAVERAEISELTARLDLQDAQKQLYSSIETYWQNATNSRAKYEAARVNVASLQKSYELVSEQFRLGLTNIAELLTSRGNLLTARQELLQDKYTALLNTALLNFYRGEVIAL